MDGNNMENNESGNTGGSNVDNSAGSNAYNSQQAAGTDSYNGGQFSGGQPGQNMYHAGQQNYQQPYQPAYQPELEEPVSLMDYFGSLLLFNLVPCVGLIICIVWAFSKDTKKSKANFCKAYLILQLILFVIGIVVSIAVLAFIGSVGYELANYKYY